MPQSNERFATREALREMQRAFPNPPEIRLKRLLGGGDHWLVETESFYDGEPWLMVMVVEMKDELIVRETRYYTQPFEAPAWRAQWVTPIDA